jgi:hypothetical protein
MLKFGNSNGSLHIERDWVKSSTGMTLIYIVVTSTHTQRERERQTDRQRASMHYIILQEFNIS